MEPLFKKLPKDDEDDILSIGPSINELLGVVNDNLGSIIYLQSLQLRFELARWTQNPKTLESLYLELTALQADHSGGQAE